MNFLELIRQCLTGRDEPLLPHNAHYNANLQYLGGPKSASSEPTEDELAASVVSLILNAEKLGKDLVKRIETEIHTAGWYEGLAKKILDGLVAALDAGAQMAKGMKEAFDRAYAIAKKFAEEHPVLAAVMTTLIAIGILVIVIPWAVEALGFGELGPIAGKFCKHPVP